MARKVLINLTTGLEDPERVTVAFLVGGAAAERGETVAMWLTKEAVRLARELRPDVVIMDILMPVMDGLAATQAIRQELPDVEVLALTSVLDDASVTGAIRAGAIGYLLKNAEADELQRAIKSAAEGKVQLSPEAAARLVHQVQVPGSPEALTERETAVLRLLARGRANKQIARELKIGEQTVKTHVSNILSKLSLQSRTQAALFAMERGLVSAADARPK